MTAFRLTPPSRLLLRRLSLPMLFGVLAAPALAQYAGGGGATSVGVVTLATEEAPYQVTLPGRAVAHDQTEVRPRVEGVVQEIPFQAGAQVKAGDVLFRLDTETYDVNLSAAEAELASAEASRDDAEATVGRYQRLANVGVTQSDLDTAKAELASAQAAVKSAEASLKSAHLDLDRTVIRSPIDGIVDLSEVSVGALVTANQTDALTTVTTMDPIYVDVQESSARMLRVRKRMEDGTLTPADSLDISLTLETGDTYDGEGKLVSPRSEVSTTTGTIDFRIEFDNPDKVILPGQFLRVTMTLGKTQAIMVPQRATSRSADGTLTAFLAVDGKAKQVNLTSAGTWKNAWIVTDGVADGDKLIVDGLQNLTDGADVTTVAVTIDDEGLVQDVTTGSGE